MRGRLQNFFLGAAIGGMIAWAVITASGKYADWGVLFTILTTLSLGLWALMRSDWRHVESRLIVTALFICAFADYVLGTGTFMAGMVSFLVVQVLFCIIFLRQILPRRPSALPFVAWIIFSTIMLGGIILPAIHDDIMRVAVLLYSACLICTASLGADAWLNAVKKNKTRDRFAAIGGGLFLLSDMLIGMTQFGAIPLTLLSSYVMMGFYWGALVCITLSVAERRTR